RVGTSAPHKHFPEVVAKLNKHGRSHVTIRIEPRENLLEAFGWDCRISSHFRVLFCLNLTVAGEPLSSKLKYYQTSNNQHQQRQQYKSWSNPGIVLNDDRIRILTLQLEPGPVIRCTPLFVSHHLQFCSPKCGGRRKAFLQHRFIEVSH